MPVFFYAGEKCKMKKGSCVILKFFIFQYYFLTDKTTLMKESFGLKSNNKHLQQFRFKLYLQRKFLKKFYTPFWLQQPTKAGLIATIALWLVAIVFLISNKNIFHTNVFYLLLSFAAFSLIVHFVAYYKTKRKTGRF